MIIVVMGKSTQSYVRIFGLILDIVRENFTMEHFGLVSEYALTGDQPLFVLLINKAIFITATIEKENKFNCKGIEFEIEIRNKVKEKLWIILN